VKHARRGVYRAGVMLYFGVPTPFVDTSDVWLAGTRHRLLASFAGPWAELVLGSACATTAFLLPDGPLGAALFAWAFACLLQTAFQFFPLLELDGYYLLIDLIEQPRLRARSLAYVRGPLWSDLGRLLRTGERPTREQCLLAWFGLGSAGASLLACVLAVLTWRHWLGPLLAEVWHLAVLLAATAR
jgi:putative peptide zinc metalloprotease protein